MFSGNISSLPHVIARKTRGPRVKHAMMVPWAQMRLLTVVGKLRCACAAILPRSLRRSSDGRFGAVIGAGQRWNTRGRPRRPAVAIWCGRQMEIIVQRWSGCESMLGIAERITDSGNCSASAGSVHGFANVTEMFRFDQRLWKFIATDCPSCAGKLQKSACALQILASQD